LPQEENANNIYWNGRVKVNSNIITELGTKIDPDKDIVEFDDKIVKHIEDKKYTYILLNKPIDYVTTAKDQFRQTNGNGFNKGNTRGQELCVFRKTQSSCPLVFPSHSSRQIRHVYLRSLDINR